MYARHTFRSFLITFSCVICLQSTILDHLMLVDHIKSPQKCTEICSLLRDKIPKFQWVLMCFQVNVISLTDLVAVYISIIDFLVASKLNTN